MSTPSIPRTHDRRAFLQQTLIAGAALGALPFVARRAEAARRSSDGTRTTIGLTPEEALARLAEGNRRFASGHPEAPHRDLARLRELEQGQAPFAAVLGCSDSRVPVEIVFDQGFGDLFPVRVAGNIVSPEVIGSLEFGAAVLGASAIVVLGHARCGAVKATLEGTEVPGQISALYYHIQPAVDGAEGKLDLAIERNVRAQVALLQRASPVLAARGRAGQVRIVGAVYDIGSGQVRWLDR